MMKGFTLVELLLTLVILGILMGGIYVVFNISQLASNEDMALLSLQQQGRQAMDGMTREIRKSKSGLSDITITTPGPNSGAVIIFKIPSNSYCFKYSVNNNRIIREIINCTTAAQLKQQILANDMNSLNFSRSGNTVEIKLSLKKTVRRRDLCFPNPCETPPVLPKTLTEKVRLRN